MLNSYAILGCNPGDSLTTIKRSYRSLAKEYHPDCVRAVGASSRLVAEAQREFLKIDRAYKELLSYFRS